MTREALITDEMPVLIERQKNLQRMRDKHLRLVEEKMPEPQTHNRPNNRPNGDLVELLLRESFRLENFLQRVVRQQEAQGQQNSVPSDLQRTEMESHRIHFPSHKT